MAGFSPIATFTHRLLMRAARLGTAAGGVLMSLALVLPAAAPAQTSPTTGGGDDIVPLPLVAPKPEQFVGLWNYHSGQPTVAGRCPAGTPTSGQVSITYDQSAAASDVLLEGPVMIDILSGTVCKPASLCHLRGHITENAVSAGAYAIADNEGGQASVLWTLHFTSDKTAMGTSASNYTHPQGFECNWASNLVLTRPKKD